MLLLGAIFGLLGVYFKEEFLEYLGVYAGVKTAIVVLAALAIGAIVARFNNRNSGDST